MTPLAFVEDTCPICGEQTEDMRHVDVECFYKVDERLSEGTLYTKTLLAPVPEEDTYLGHVRRYSGGLREAWVEDVTKRTESAAGHTSSSWATHLVPLDPPDLRAVETQFYGTRCCKACRGAFLTVFHRWLAGEFVHPSPEPDDERNIPVRNNGVTVFITRSEWDARQASRDRDAHPESPFDVAGQP